MCYGVQYVHVRAVVQSLGSTSRGGAAPFCMINMVLCFEKQEVMGRERKMCYHIIYSACGRKNNFNFGGFGFLSFLWGIKDDNNQNLSWGEKAEHDVSSGAKASPN